MSSAVLDFSVFKGQKVFISGGAGVIGSALVHILHDAGANILVGELKTRPSDWPESIHYRQGDLNEVDPSWLRSFQPAYFFHLAATFERTEESYEHWAANDRHNLRLGHYLLDILKQVPSLKVVVFASSYLIYDENLYLSETAPAAPVSLHEEMPIRPRNLTGMAKLQHEMELNFLAGFPQTPFAAISARIFRVFGRGSRDVISRWIRALLRGEPIEVYGKEAFFDYIFADEVARGLALLAEKGQACLVNLGSGEAHRVDEVVKFLQKKFPDAQVVERGGAGRLEASQAEMSRFEALTGWRPARTPWAAIETLIEYERKQLLAPEANRPGKVLITSLARKVPMVETARAALRRLGWDVELLGGDSDPGAPGRAFVDGFWEMPRLDELETEALIASLQSLGVGFVIPSRDGELAYFAARREALQAAGIEVMVSRPEVVARCLDKQLFSDFLTGLPVIPSFAEPPAGVDRLVVKERSGAGGVSVGVDLDRAAALAWSTRLKSPIFQPYRAGKEYSIDLYAARGGAVKGVVVRSRDRVIGGESQITTTRDFPGLERLCTRAAELLGIEGHAVFQAIVDEQGGFHLIECNARFGGASRASAAVGLESLYWFLLEASGGDLSRVPFERGANLRMRRFACDRFESVE